MAELFARVSVLIGVAFALGVAVGWLFWRYQRRSVALSEWQATHDELAELRRRFEVAVAGRDALAGVVAGSRQEVLRLTDVVTATWNERNELRGRLASLEALLSHRAAELAQATARVDHLQRRVIELNGLATRALDVAHRPLAEPSSGRPRAHGSFPPVVPGGGWDTPVRG
jgi:hypothetical protein